MRVVRPMPSSTHLIPREVSSDVRGGGRRQSRAAGGCGAQDRPLGLICGGSGVVAHGQSLILWDAAVGHWPTVDWCVPPVAAAVLAAAFCAAVFVVSRSGCAGFESTSELPGIVSSPEGRRVARVEDLRVRHHHLVQVVLAQDSWHPRRGSAAEVGRLAAVEAGGTFVAPPSCRRRPEAGRSMCE